MKRLFRKWLKKQIIATGCELWDNAFEWVYESPITQWRLKLWCVRKSRQFGMPYELIYEWVNSFPLSF